MNKVKKNKEKIKWPVVSMMIVAYNDAGRLERCLKSIKGQDYPQKLIDIVLVDDGSTDDTIKVAKKYGAKVFVNKGGYIYKNWMIGVKKIKGEFFFTPETDIVLGGTDFIKKMVSPMIDDDRIMASFTDEKGAPDMHWTARFLSYNHAQADPLLEFLFDDLKKKIIEKKRKYSLCKFDEKLQPAVRMFFRTKYLKKTSNWKAKEFIDHDFVVNCVREGYSYFAYVPNPGYFHYHVTGLRHLMKKRVRNIQMHYLPCYKKTDYVILDTSSKKQVLKLILFVIYANLIIPATIRGIFRSIKHRDMVLLAEPIITVGIVDSLLVAFLKDKNGRRFILDSFSTVLG